MGQKVHPRGFRLGVIAIPCLGRFDVATEPVIRARDRQERFGISVHDLLSDLISHPNAPPLPQQPFPSSQ